MTVRGGLLAWVRRMARPSGSAVPPADTPITQTDRAMMRRALDLARGAAAAGEVPVGAVVYRGDDILGEGANRREADHDPAAHAELIAIRAAALRLGDWRLEHCSIAVTLEPCPMCAGLIVNARVDRVVFGAADPRAGACGTLFDLARDRRLNHRALVAGGLLADESADLLRAFFRARR